MGFVINTGSFHKGLWPGVKKAFGDAYGTLPAEYEQIFNTVSSDKAYEEYVSVSPFGTALAKAEGTEISYDYARQGFVTRLTNITFALGFQVTMEEMDDNKFLPEAPKRAQALAKSFIQAKEDQGALILTRAFTSTYSGADGKELCATDHPNKAGGTFSNELTTAADISEAALEQLVAQIYQATDDRGKKINIAPKSLVVAPADVWEANRILKSALQNDTGNNAINALKAMNIFPGGVVMNRFYNAGNGAFFILTDIGDTGLIYQERQGVKFGMDNNSDNFNAKFFGYERYAFGWADPRGIYGSAGAA